MLRIKLNSQSPGNGNWPGGSGAEDDGRYDLRDR